MKFTKKINPGTFEHLKRHFRSHTIKDVLILLGACACIVVGIGVFWVSSFRLPDISSFDQRKISESTKVFDRTGKILLFDMNAGIKRTVVTGDAISPYVKKATVAIEDGDFYEHGGIKFTSIIRAVFANLVNGEYSQGGSTITQQVVKNTLLTTEKTITRKLKEWVLAIKLDKSIPKDKILEIYLNENPYGGNIYGVEEASQQFYGKPSKDVSVAEAAYLAAIPQATTYYSPYGKNITKLEERKNLVLSRMRDHAFITQAEYDTAIAEKVTFQPRSQFGIRAAHFVFYVKQYLETVLGTGALDTQGYKIITTIDAELQAQAEESVKTTALSNKENFNAENAALIALDPKSGDILSMVGSRDYFDKEIDGQFNVAVDGRRQPGSTMKPIIYSEAFIKGYTPDTVLFDLQTEFSSECTIEMKPKNPEADPKVCYHPQNYDDTFRGPITLRNALAQSINVPSVKTLYLAGIKDSLSLAKDMGVVSLTNADQYGLTLVLGGGEVSLLEMTSAYGVFANNGTRVPPRSVLQVFDSKGNEIVLPGQKRAQVMPANVAQTISSILSDNQARTPAYGANSVLYFQNRDVAVKTGTTNDSKDAWTIGYTPNMVIGVWAGNNDNSPMVKKVAGQIVAPLWSSFMKYAIGKIPDERFTTPTPADPSTLKPVMKGLWQGGQSYTIDKISGKLATEYTPVESREEKAVQSIHSILYWVDKNDPLGPAPVDPMSDTQFEYWEAPVRLWAQSKGLNDQDSSVIPTQKDDVHVANDFRVAIQNIDSNASYSLNSSLSLFVSPTGRYPMSKVSLYINGVLIDTIDRQPFIFRFSPSDIPSVKESNNVRVVGTDTVFNQAEASMNLKVQLD